MLRVEGDCTTKIGPRRPFGDATSAPASATRSRCAPLHSSGSTSPRCLRMWSALETYGAAMVVQDCRWWLRETLIPCNATATGSLDCAWFFSDPQLTNISGIGINFAEIAIVESQVKMRTILELLAGHHQRAKIAWLNHRCLKMTWLEGWTMGASWGCHTTMSSFRVRQTRGVPSRLTMAFLSHAGACEERSVNTGLAWLSKLRWKTLTGVMACYGPKKTVIYTY